MKQTVIEIENSNSNIYAITCHKCLLADITNNFDGENVFYIFCKFYKKYLFQQKNNNSFSVKIINNAPEFCKVETVIVNERE